MSKQPMPAALRVTKTNRVRRLDILIENFSIGHISDCRKIFAPSNQKKQEIIKTQSCIVQSS